MQRTPTCRNCCRNYSFHVLSKQKCPNVPLLLDCAHTFCENCLTKFASTQKTQIACPECSVPTILTREGALGVKDLSVDIYIMGILATNIFRKNSIESFSNKKGGHHKVASDKGIPRGVAILSGLKAAKSNKVPDLKCEECFSASATSRCIKCECVFCMKCFEKVHSLSHTLRKHKPLQLLSTSHSNKSSTGCHVHDNRPLEFYDKDENKPVCAHCIVSGEREVLNIVPITEVADEIKEQLVETLNTGRTILKHLEKSQQKIRSVLTQNQAEKTVLVNEIREHFQLATSFLQVRENALVHEVESAQCQEDTLEMSVAESIRKTRNYILELEDALLDPTTLIARSKEFVSEFQEFQDMACFAVKAPRNCEDLTRFSYEKESLDSLKEYGKVLETVSVRLDMKKLCDVNEEDMNDDDQEDESLDVQDDEPPLEDNNDVVCHGQRTHAARRMLNIPYRHEMVQVTHIKDPSCFVVQRLADMDQLHVMMNAINKHCEMPTPSDLVYEVNIGDIVCAQFSGDNHWYRARIMSLYSPSHPNTLPTIDNDLSVHVLYMDFGNTEWVPMIRLRSIPTKFLHVPDMAVSCCLDDIVPPFQQTEWPSKTIKAFGSLTGNKPLLMTAHRRGAGGLLHVDLKCPDDEEPTHDDDRPASVRDALVFLEVARFKSPASQANVNGQLSFPMRVFKNPAPLEEGESIPVLVTHATGPDDVYLQLIKDENVHELLNVMDEMDKLYSSKNKRKDLQVTWPYRGLVCGARFTEDKMWYRALIIGVNSDETVDVNYVDYGNSERLPFSAVRKLPDAFLALPRQARRASLADIKQGDGDWSNKVRQFVCELLIGKPFKATITSVSEDDMAIVLYDTSSIKDVSVNVLLVQSHLAVPAGMGIAKDYVEEEKISEESEENSVVDKDVEKDNGEEVSDDVDECTEIEPGNKPSPLDKLTGLSPPEQKPGPSLKESLEPNPSEDMTDSSSSEQSPETSFQEPVLESSSVNHRPGSLPVGATYKPAPLPDNKQFQAGVTYVGMDGMIYAQEIKPDDKTLIDLMSKLNKKEGNVLIPTSIDDITIGQPCCARFSGDDLWYRALVTKVISDKKIEVHYVDFGNSEIVSLSALNLSPPDIEIPKQCLQIVLYGVVPACSERRWTVKATSVLSKLVVGKNCSAMIEGEAEEGHPIEVRLCSPEGQNISDVMLSQGLVLPRDVLRRQDPSLNVLPAGVRMGPVCRERTKHPSRAQTKLQAMLIGAREADQLLPNTRLPEVNMSFDVIVTHVQQPDCLFVQRSPNCDTDVYDIDPTLLDVEDELERLEDMQMNINRPDYFKKYEPLTHASKGMLCCGKYTEDDTWYRAQVLDIMSENPLRALVRYIDYGNSEELTAERMRGFPSELLDLPIQATECRLAHIRPPKYADSTPETVSWPETSKEQLIELVVGKILEATIVAYGSPISIELHTISGDENSNIGKTLAQQGHATYKHRSNHDNDGNESLDTMSEGAPSHCSYDVEIEDEQIIENDETIELERMHELKESTVEETNSIENTATSDQGDDLLEKDWPSQTGLATTGIPLLTPDEFVQKSSEKRDVNDTGSHDNEKPPTKIKVNEDAKQSEV